MIIGLTGSIAMGKSATSQMFANFSIPVFDADNAVHVLYDLGGAAVEPIQEVFPAAVIDGRVDRSVLSKMIVKNPNILRQIEKIVHPFVFAMEKQFIEVKSKAGKKVIVMDNPMLFETKGNERVDKVIVVSTSSAIQKIRALARDGMTKQKLDFIISRQIPDDQKRKMADFVIDTSVSFFDAFNQLQKILVELNPDHTMIENPYA